MSQWKKIASSVALSLAMALTATGCVNAAGDDDETKCEAPIAAVASGEETSNAGPADQAGDEQVGEANQAFFSCFDDGGHDFLFKLLFHRFFFGHNFILPFFGTFPFIGGCGGCGGC
ncbi:MAG: hypothetical protein QM820_15015 [Minicystis sp.]